MTDNLNIRGPADAARINLNEPWEVNYWCKKFNVTVSQLRGAVHAVGVSAAAVEKYLL